ncbi:Cation channel complex component UNC80 N-terminal [Trinorchestia longiramus]|nr:Cation channel complex component UNC80 N-terminal [Trinorchestia longiramus]
MTKRRHPDDDSPAEDVAVPLSIQTFLWRQSSPFIRPKLGKLHEATCMVITLDGHLGSLMPVHDCSHTCHVHLHGCHAK